MAAASKVGGMLRGQVRLKLYPWSFREAMDESFWGMEADAWAATDGLCVGPGLAMRLEAPAKEDWNSDDFSKLSVIVRLGSPSYMHCTCSAMHLIFPSCQVNGTTDQVKSPVLLNRGINSEEFLVFCWTRSSLKSRLTLLSLMTKLKSWPVFFFFWALCCHVKRWKQSMKGRQLDRLKWWTPAAAERPGHWKKSEVCIAMQL